MCWGVRIQVLWEDIIIHKHCKALAYMHVAGKNLGEFSKENGRVGNAPLRVLANI